MAGLTLTLITGQNVAEPTICYVGEEKGCMVPSEVVRKVLAEHYEKNYGLTDNDKEVLLSFKRIFISDLQSVFFYRHNVSYFDYESYSPSSSSTFEAYYSITITAKLGDLVGLWNITNLKNFFEVIKQVFKPVFVIGATLKKTAIPVFSGAVAETTRVQQNGLMVYKKAIDDAYSLAKDLINEYFIGISSKILNADHFKQSFSVEEAFDRFIKSIAKEYVKLQLSTKDMIYGNKVKLYINLKTIPNFSFGNERLPVPVEYIIERGAYTRMLTDEALKKAYNMSEQELLQALKQNSILSFLIERNYPFEVSLKIIPSRIQVDGEPHHFNLCAVCTVDVEYIHAYYEDLNMRKTYLFFNNGLLTIESPMNFCDTQISHEDNTLHMAF